MKLLLSLTLLGLLVVSVHAQELKERVSFAGPKEKPNKIVVSPNGNYLLLANKDAWELRDGTTGKMIRTGKTELISATFSENSQSFAICDKDGQVVVHKLVSPGGNTDRGTTFKGVPGLLTFTPKGEIVVAQVVGGRETVAGEPMNWVEVRLSNVVAGKSRTLLRAASPVALPGIGANFNPVVFSPDGSRLAVGSFDAGGTYRVSIVNTDTGKASSALCNLLPENVLAFSQDGRTLVYTSRFQTEVGNPPKLPAILPTLEFVDVASGVTRTQSAGDFAIVAIAADLRTVVKLDSQGKVTILETQAAAHLPRFSKARFKGMQDAVADLEKGHLRIKEYPLPAPAWHLDFVELLKRECGIEWVNVDMREVLEDPNHPRSELNGYNSVMQYEIEQRFGPGILTKLKKRAEAGEKAKAKEGNPEINKNETAESKAARARLRGLESALKEIEQGTLKLVGVPPPASPWHEDYLKLLKRECGIEHVYTNERLDSGRDAYFALMLMEIEHRYGKEYHKIFDSINQRAQQQYDLKKAK